MIVWRLAAAVYAAAKGVQALNSAREAGYRRGYAEGMLAALVVVGE